jgi:ribosomal-protein-alanine N-acetyltransferase
MPISDGLIDRAEQPVLTTDLRLEPLQPHHAALLFDGFSDAGLYTFIPQEPPADIEALRKRYQRLSARRSPDGTQAWLNWAVFHIPSERYAGLVEATVTATGADIAYFVFRQSQGQGIGRKAVGTIIAWLHDNGVATIGASIDTRNITSIALVAGLGFKQVALIKGADTFKGTVSDDFRFERRV